MAIYEKEISPSQLHHIHIPSLVSTRGYLPKITYRESGLLLRCFIESLREMRCVLSPHTAEILNESGYLKFENRSPSLT
jgi:hypothetical protein